MTPDAAMTAIDAAGLPHVRLLFADLAGVPRTVWLPTSRLGDVFASGLVVDGASLGLAEEEDGDLAVLPDPRTLRTWPAVGAHPASAVVIGEIVTAGGAPSPLNVRAVLRRLVERAAARGWESVVGAELEYYYLDPGAGKPIDRGGYCAPSDLDAGRTVRGTTVELLAGMGMEVEYAFHECGPGQQEIVVGKRDPLTTADELMLRKALIREVAAANGLKATFMPKPFDGMAGSGMHIHQSLLVHGEPVFHAPAAAGGLSQVGARYLAGQLARLPECTLLFAPWANSYKRLTTASSGPAVVTWGIESRAALVRVPRACPPSASAYRLELTVPDAACNPYLAIAAALGAGYRGIDDGIEPPPPLDGDGRGEAEHAAPGSLPETLGDALRLAEASAFLRDLLGEPLFARLLLDRRRHWRAHNARVHPSERDEMLEVT
jgi:glutamine synthetase